MSAIIRYISITLVLIFMTFAGEGLAADVPFRFENDRQKERYMNLTEELRCLVCQNQSLADSHADLAQDLRNEIYKMLDAGKSDEEIIHFLVERYGNFVLYRPPVDKTTWLLWFGPFVLLVFALIMIGMYVRSQRSQGKLLSDAEKERASRLLAGNGSGDS